MQPMRVITTALFLVQSERFFERAGRGGVSHADSQGRRYSCGFVFGCWCVGEKNTEIRDIALIRYTWQVRPRALTVRTGRPLRTQLYAVALTAAGDPRLSKWRKLFKKHRSKKTQRNATLRNASTENEPNWKEKNPSCQYETL